MSLQRQPGAAGASYSAAVTVTGPGRWIQVAGQLPADPDGRPVAGDLAAQAEACFDRIADVLAGEGAGLRDVVRIGAYLTSLEDYTAYAAVRGRRFGEALPASTAVQVAGLLGGALIEIDAVAFLDDGA